MQSWGTRSHFETRHTDLYPSKSAIIGLVAASLGYKRQETNKIKSLNQLHFAVRIDQKGKLLRDYHTAEKIKNTGSFDRTYVTHRYYLEDAVFLVGLGSKDLDELNKIALALQKPYFQGYLGRRSLPLTADFFQGLKDGDVISVLKSEAWKASPWYKRQYPQAKLTIHADASLLDTQKHNLRKDQVLSFSQDAREFGYRGEASIQVDSRDPAMTEHDAFSAIGGQNVFVTSHN